MCNCEANCKSLFAITDNVEIKSRLLTRLFAMIGVFAAIYICSWPIIFSFNLWILKDRGSF